MNDVHHVSRSSQFSTSTQLRQWFNWGSLEKQIRKLWFITLKYIVNDVCLMNNELQHLIYSWHIFNISLTTHVNYVNYLSKQLNCPKLILQTKSLFFFYLTKVFSTVKKSLYFYSIVMDARHSKKLLLLYCLARDQIVIN